MNQLSNKISDQVTVLVFKDNYAARTFQVSLSWINRLGILLGVFLAFTLTSGFLAIKYYRLSLSLGNNRSQELNAPTQTTLASIPQDIAGPRLNTALDKSAEKAPSHIAAPATPVAAPSPLTLGTKQNSPSSIYQFSAFADIHLGTIPEPSSLPFTVQTPKLTWRGKTLLVRFALQYIKGDQENQQGRIVILARGPESIYAYPGGVLNLPGKNNLISPENGEFFSVSRFREVKADFGPLRAQEILSSLEIFIFDTAGKILVYQTLAPPPKKLTSDANSQTESSEPASTDATSTTGTGSP